MTLTVLTFKTSAEPTIVHSIVARQIPEVDYPEFGGNGDIFIPARELTVGGAEVSPSNPLFIDRPPVPLKSFEFVGAGTHTIATPATGKAIAIASIDITSDVAAAFSLSEVAADESVTNRILKLPPVLGFSKEYPYPALLTSDYLLKIEYSEAATASVSIQYLEVGNG